MTLRALIRVRGFALATFAAAIACDNGPTGPAYDPVLPTAWSPAVTNPYFPLVPGTQWRYEGQISEGQELTVVEVLTDTRLINGVTASVVRDRVYLNGTLIEDTFDWFAQDDEGNVWYLGEDTKEYENGQVVSTEGSWEWGKDGALPGIVMWADPSAHVGEAYRQEFLAGTAEDWGQVVAVGQSVTVTFGAFSACVKTEEWNGLESGRENKYYCPQVGLVAEENKGGGDRSQLVAVSTP